MCKELCSVKKKKKTFKTRREINSVVSGINVTVGLKDYELRTHVSVIGAGTHVIALISYTDTRKCQCLLELFSITQIMHEATERRLTDVNSERCGTTAPMYCRDSKPGPLEYEV
jgi:hypothetical protein